jgi:hypothetical protein
VAIYKMALLKFGCRKTRNTGAAHNPEAISVFRGVKRFAELRTDANVISRTGLKNSDVWNLNEKKGIQRVDPLPPDPSKNVMQKRMIKIR